ncbi:Protein of unknown function, partial [Cotesia congregata]
NDVNEEKSSELQQQQQEKEKKKSGGSRELPEIGDSENVASGNSIMCCVLQGAGRVCPSSMRDKHHDGSTPSDRGGCNTSLATNDLPLESLWAAGLDEGMGFPQRCYYANHRTIPITPTTPNKNTEQIWHERNTPYRTPTISTGADSSIIDEIWTSSNDRKYFHASTMSSEMDSNLNIHENNRSLELRDKDSYLNDVENNKDPHKRSYYPSTPTTSGLGSSIEKTQSIETPRSHDPPSHLWYSRADDFSNYNTVKSSHAITRQPRPNPDWFKNDNKFISHRKFGGRPRNDDTEIWSSKIDNTNNMSGYMTQQNRQHRCYHQARKSFSTSMMTDLAAMLSDSQQSLGSTSILVSLSPIYLTINTNYHTHYFCVSDYLSNI